MIANLFDSTATFRRGTGEKITFLLLNQLDLVLTVLAASLGLFEVNPWMRGLMGEPVLLLVVKCGVPLLIAWVVPGKLLLPAILLLSLVVAWNIKELLVFCF